jgi:hypothetical protein
MVGSAYVAASSRFLIGLGYNVSPTCPFKLEKMSMLVVLCGRFHHVAQYEPICTLQLIPLRSKNP